MQNRPLILMLIFLVALNLFSCTSFSLRKHPSPTSTISPTLAPTNTPTVHARADEIALNLSGDQAIECVNMMDIYNGPVLKVDQCIVEALQTKQPFRALRSLRMVDWTDYYWIVGTPTGEIYLVFYEDGWLGPWGPEKQFCENPHISTYVDYQNNITNIKFLECK